MLIASADYQRHVWSSPSVDLSSNVRSYSTLVWQVADVKNRPLNFDSKPPCWSSDKRTLMSALRKLVSVFQSIPHILISLVPCCGTSAARTAGYSKESNKVNPLPKPPRTFEYNSKVDDLPGMQNTSATSRTIKSVNTSLVIKENTEKPRLYNPLNRHGNMFQGFNSCAPLIRLEAIKNINTTPIIKGNTEKPRLYNPLNRHGNTFQGFNYCAPLIRLEAMKNINTASIIKGNTEKPRLYDSLNRYGNTLQKYNVQNQMARLGNKESIATKIIYSDSYEESDLLDNDNLFDKYLFDNYNLFNETNENHIFKSVEDCREVEKIVKKEFNPKYYTITYLD